MIVTNAKLFLAPTMQGVILTSNISQPFPAVQTGIQDSLKHPSFGPKDFSIMIKKICISTATALPHFTTFK